MNKKQKAFWQTLYGLCAVFLFGAALGWVYELFVRRFAGGEWGNPGMLFGPYLPIYGFGAAALFALAHLPIPIKNKGLKMLIWLLVTGVVLTAVEYIGGLIFVKWLGLNLWSYEGFAYNVQGLICPLCSLGWALAGGVYLWFLHPLFLRIKGGVLQLQGVQFFLAAGIGGVLIDFFISLFL